MMPYLKLENRFASYIGTRHAVSVNTGTAALHLALAALGIGPGDEVIVPDFTMYACALAVHYTGAKPVFVDCNDSLLIDPNLIEERITGRTKAIMPVHIYGRVCDMVRIGEIATKHGLAIVEDCSECHGATAIGYGTMKMAGSVSTIGCFSFYRNKIVHAEEGGICVTDDDNLAAKMRDMKNMAFGDRHDFMHTGLGFNYRMPDAMAEMALKSLDSIDYNLAIRRKIANVYDEYFGSKAISRPLGSVIWVYDYICGEAHVDRIVKEIPGARHFFKPMSQQKLFESGQISPKAIKYSSQGVYLPVREDMDLEEAELICKAITTELT